MSCSEPLVVSPVSARPVKVVERAVAHGRDAMAFLAVERAMRHWFDAGPPQGTGACVAYIETAAAWVAACSPLVDADEQSYARQMQQAASRFVDAARASGRRACFFGSEASEPGGMTRMFVGEQPVFRPREWLADLPRRRRLREQLRRARAKGVRTRLVAPGDLEDGSPLRLEVDRLAESWLRSRHIQPMGFLVALEPFHSPSLHRYFVAEVDGQVVGFLSAVPIGRRRAWLVEDVVRRANAPNGTTETLIVALMREEKDSAYITLGLTPLSGAVAWPLRIVRWLSRPLFDFEGLRAFRERLHPHAWHPVWLLYPRGQSSLLPVVDSLRAFAGGSLLSFAARSFVRHPSGMPWALALPLPMWTVGLAWLVTIGRTSLLGFPRMELALWAVFDALLLLVLVSAAMRPRRSRLLLATSLAAVDAALSLGHLTWVGLGSTPLRVSLRAVSTIAPVLGALLLGSATTRTSAATR
jgi:lysylphosphatidylglycerol synthetase-like protein (DUF2156 family)